MQKKLKKLGEIINSEGSILSLYRDTIDNVLYLKSFLSDGTGIIYYSTKDTLLGKYFDSEITLNDLYLQTDDDKVVFKSRRDESILVKKDAFKDKIQCGKDKYNELPSGMKCERLNYN
jgi:hypothetical protein